MVSRTFLSIVIPVLDEEDNIVRCLDSILRQASECNDLIEIVVVDNGCMDRTIERALTYRVWFKRFKITYMSGSLACARNKGVAVASNNNIFFLDADQNLAPGCLRAILSKVGSNVDGFDALLGRVAIKCHKGSGLCLYQKRIWELDHLWKLKSKRLTTFHSGGLLIKKDVFQRLGGFDETLYVAEDGDFARRFIESGHRVKYEPSIIVFESARTTLRGVTKVAMKGTLQHCALFNKHRKAVFARRLIQSVVPDPTFMYSLCNYGIGLRHRVMLGFLHIFTLTVRMLTLILKLTNALEVKSVRVAKDKKRLTRVTWHTDHITTPTILSQGHRAR